MSKIFVVERSTKPAGWNQTWKGTLKDGVVFFEIELDDVKKTKKTRFRNY